MPSRSRPLRPARSLVARFSAVVACAIALLVSLAAPTAWARGSLKLESTSLQESNGRWKLKFTIDYGSIPSLPTIQAIFSFKPTMLYERALTDQSPKDPVITKKPLQNQPDNNVPTDIGFSDPASGKLYQVTKFTVELRRDRDFEAGEYDLTVRLDDGSTLGSRIHLVLNGDNPIVDRRAITFVADDKPKPKPGSSAAASASAEAGKYDPAHDPEPGAIPDDVPPPLPTATPPKVEPGAKKGCGCRLVGDDTNPAWGIAALAGLSGAALLRRRRRHAAHASR